MKILFKARKARQLWYFEPPSPFWKRSLLTCQNIGLFSFEAKQVDCHVGHVRNTSGGSDFIKLLESVRQITDTIRNDLLNNHPLVRAMEPEWPTRKVVLYFEKLVEQKIRIDCLRLYLAEWILRSRMKLTPDQGILFVEGGLWHSHLETFSRTIGMRLDSYWRFWDLHLLSRANRFFFSAISKRIRRMANKVLGHSEQLKNPSESPTTQPPGLSSLAIHYWYRNLSFLPTERSEFFWLQGSNFPTSEIILYDYVNKQPLDDTTHDDLQNRGVRIFGQAPQIPGWRATSQVWHAALPKITRLIQKTFSCLIRHWQISLHDLNHMFHLIIEYALWYDFFYSNRVRINVGIFNTSVGQVLALDDLGGVSISYQISVSNIIFPSRLLTSGENVQFVFSPLFEKLWRQMEAPVDTFVNTGFIYDGAIASLRRLDRVKKIRSDLKSKGSRFILCFFDEYTWNQWHVPAWNEDAEIDYKYLLNWLLEDPTLGIVFKPKKFSNLFQRLSGLTELIEKARCTGRCHFMTSDQTYGNIFPAEAALVSDLCVGKLVGSTAAFESQLAGIPTLMVDSEELHDHPLRHASYGNIIFDSWPLLRKAVDEYRKVPEYHPNFGKWTPGLNQLDPFQDGNAGIRMGSYIYSVYESLKRGISRNEALAIASRQYAERWGDGPSLSEIEIHAKQRATS